MKTQAILTIGLPLIGAAAAALFANQWINKQLGSGVEDLELTPVVVAATGIPVGTELNATHLKMVGLPPDSAPDESFRELDEVVGKVTRQPVYAGEILMVKRVVEHAGGSPLAATIEEGKRAITVRVDDVIGVAGFLLPGSRVDVIASEKKPEGGYGSRTILQNLKVLAVDQTTGSAETDRPVVVRAVTLEVGPREAEIIAMATEKGKVRLTLRNPIDLNQVAQPEPESEPQTPVAAAPEAEPAPIERVSLVAVDVIRGMDLTTTTIAE